jgi:uncharacterized membrane protein
MVAVHTSRAPAEAVIILRSNHSLSWRGNLLVVCLCLVISMIIGIPFALMGAWVILPIAGAEVLLLLMALYWVTLQADRQEVLHVRPKEVRVEKGRRCPDEVVTLERPWLQVRLQETRRPWRLPRISLCVRERCIMIGEFLNAKDQCRLLKQLERLGLPFQH